MARLQILELPRGINDERPPFILVIDQYEPPPFPVDITEPGPYDDVAEKLGARTVLVFEETVGIPANDPLPAPAAADPERAGTTEIVYAHERTRLDLCSVLLVDSGTTWRRLIEIVCERQRQLADLYRRLAELTASGGGPTLAQVALKYTGKPYSYDRAEPDGQPSEVIEQLKADLHEARMWARHGYEIGQRHCGWTDHGVAPNWLTEGWPNSFDSCEHLKRAAELDEALTRVLEVAADLDHLEAHGGAWDANQQAAQCIRKAVGRRSPAADEPGEEQP